MKLIGMLDSPFVRRVAISLQLLELPYEHCNWSVGRDFDQIRAYSPLGRVPALVLDDGAVLTESSAVLDYVDDRVGAARALLPPTGLPTAALTADPFGVPASSATRALPPHRPPPRPGAVRASRLRFIAARSHLGAT